MDGWLHTSCACTMNWMTSGRKRVQRSQKIKELRAKHFAKVAADRVRALPKPIRSSTSRESADVSRLKTRWVPTSHQGQASSGRDSSGPSIAHDSRAVDTTLLVNSSEDIACPMLKTDTTSPSTFRRTETGANIEEQTSSIVDFTQGFGSSAWPPSEHQRQEMPLGMTPSMNADPHSLSFASTKTALAYRGSGESSEVSDLEQDYESRILGSECLPSSTMLRATGGTQPYGNHDANSGVTSSFAGEDNGAPVFSGYSNKQMRIGNAMLPKENPLRFFDSGIEVALDGSPVSSSTTCYPGQMITPAAQFRTSSGDSGIEAYTSPKAAQSTERGLPKFRTSVSLEEGTIPSKEKPFSSPEELDNASLDDPYPGGEARFTPTVSEVGHSRAEEELEEELDINTHQSMSDRDNMSNGEQHGMPLKSSQATEDAPGFEALARNWGLFGGALDSPTSQNTGAILSNGNRSATVSEGITKIDSSQDRTCRDGRTFPKNTNALQDKLCQPTPGQASESDLPSHVPMEADGVRPESPELVMLWHINESSFNVEVSGKEMVHPSHGMAQECAKRHAEPLLSESRPGNTKEVHPEVPASHPDVPGASPYPTTAAHINANEMEPEEVARPVTWPSMSTKKRKHDPQGEGLGNTIQGLQVKTRSDTPKGLVDQNQPGFEFGGKYRGSGRRGETRERGQRKQTLSFEGAKEHSHRSKPTGGDDPCSRHSVREPEQAPNARLGSPCNKVDSTPRDQDSPHIGAMTSVSPKGKESDACSMDMVRKNAPSVVIAGRKNPMKRAGDSSHGIFGSVSRDVGRSEYHVAKVRRQGGMGIKDIYTRGSGSMETDPDGNSDQYSTIVWYRTIVACLMAASTS